MATDEEPECANPLFLKWITEWYEEARARNAKTQYTLKKACTSLQRYPLRIENAQDTVQLQGIGQGIADRLAKKLAGWRKDQGIAEPPAATAALSPSGSADASTSADASKSTRQKSGPRLYVPRYRSGAFALLIGLLKTYCLYGADYFIPKSELVPMCETYADAPFHVGGTSHGGSAHAQHTAWSGMKTLEAKALAERQGGVKFCLTEEGVEIAKKVVEVLRTRGELSDDDARVFSGLEAPTAATANAASPSSSDFGDIVHANISGDVTRPRAAGMSRSASASFSRNSSATAQVELADLTSYPADSYDIILVIDNREVHSTADRALIERELAGVRTEIRPLTVGDYLWIARAKHGSPQQNQPDVVLDYVVERKRMDDLCASIKDGRYKEQHARIHATGFSNVFYVVEGNDPDAVARLGETAVASALSRIQVIEAFHLKQPPTFEATLRLLAQITEILKSTLKCVYAIPDSLIGLKGFRELKQNMQARFPQAHLAISFDAYDVVSNKSGSLAVGEIFLRMLMTVRGVSADKVLTIAGQYPTAQLLACALESDAGVKAVDELVIDGSSRKIGPALAKRLAQFWTTSSFATH
ncbi:Crossover junction endonuclease mus81 [Coemansia sp. RSA 2618]|nr:Crossover junction endonuclease mus81 [Coemansia sp. RSA 2618]